LEEQQEKHRDAYNQAIGGLQLLDYLENIGGEQAISESTLESMLDARIQSIEPLTNGK
jgi:hypothetical protein